MADRSDNVIVLPGRGGAGGRQPASIEILRTAIGELDELYYCLHQISPHSHWSAQRWMIASTPFRMRLIGVRKRLDDLVKTSRAHEQNNIRWVLEFNDARLGIEQRLRDVDRCLQTLQRVNASPSECARKTEIFVSSRSELLKALRKIRQLLVQRCAAVLSGN
jgi:hypothetical protein